MQNPLEFDDCEYDSIGRIYRFKSGQKYYSTTTVMGATADHDYLDAWRERIGDEQADAECQMACDVGEEFHLLGEKFLLGEPLPKVGVLPTTVFNKTKPILRNNITAIHGVETVLYSIMLRIAGRADAIVDWNGELAILDFKFLKHFNMKWVHDYWLQLCLYAHMWQQMTGNKPPKLVLVIGNKHNFQSKFFTSTTTNHDEETANRIYDFKKMHD